MYIIIYLYTYSGHPSMLIFLGFVQIFYITYTGVKCLHIHTHTYILIKLKCNSCQINGDVLKDSFSCFFKDT